MKFARSSADWRHGRHGHGICGAHLLCWLGNSLNHSRDRIRGRVDVGQISAEGACGLSSTGQHRINNTRSCDPAQLGGAPPNTRSRRPQRTQRQSHKRQSRLRSRKSRLQQRSRWRRSTLVRPKPRSIASAKLNTRPGGSPPHAPASSRNYGRVSALGPASWPFVMASRALIVSLETNRQAEGMRSVDEIGYLDCHFSR